MLHLCLVSMHNIQSRRSQQATVVLPALANVQLGT